MFLVDQLYGILASWGLWQKEANIFFLGRSELAKTTLIHILKDERLVQHELTQYTEEVLHQPTQNQPVEELSFGKIKFKAFDMGDPQFSLRVLNDYCAKVDAVVHLIAARIDGNFQGSTREIHAFLSAEALADVPFLILGHEFYDPCDVYYGYAMFEIEQSFYKRCMILRTYFPLPDYVLRGWWDLRNYTTGKGNVNLKGTNVRPLEVFMWSIKLGYGDAFKWLFQYIN